MKIVSRLTGIAATALLVASTPASALVASWDFAVDSVFTQYTLDFHERVNDNGTDKPNRYVTHDEPDGVTKISWGVPGYSGNGQKSSLVINNPTATGTDVLTWIGSGDVPKTDDYIGKTLSLTHNNNPLLRNADNANNLTSAILKETVLLTPTGSSTPLDPFVFDFSIGFKETPNDWNSAKCPVPLVGGDCGDVFVLTGGLLNSFFDYDDGSGDGLLRYYVNIFPTSGGVLSTLPDAACILAGEKAGCIGFTTAENKKTTIAFGFTISTEKLGCDPGECPEPPPVDPEDPDPAIPEPGTLALFGLGLMGLIGSRRRLQR